MRICSGQDIDRVGAWPLQIFQKLVRTSKNVFE
jgi:hypothetical protein